MSQVVAPLLSKIIARFLLNAENSGWRLGLVLGRLGTNSHVPSPASLPSDLWIVCGAVLVRSCAELYLAEMHNRCNSPHRSGPQHCQVAGRQRAGSMMCCPSVSTRLSMVKGLFAGYIDLRQPRSKFTVS